MFISDKNTIITALTALRKRLCSYSSSDNWSCDCKYGATDETIFKTSENGSGCPEVMAAAAILSVMTPSEYEKLCKRASTWPPKKRKTTKRKTK